MTPLTYIVLYLAGLQYVSQASLVALGFSAHDLESLSDMRISIKQADSLGRPMFRYRRFTEKVSFKAAA